MVCVNMNNILKLSNCLMWVLYFFVYLNLIGRCWAKIDMVCVNLYNLLKLYNVLCFLNLILYLYLIWPLFCQNYYGLC